MSTIKISQLPIFNTIDSGNTSNVILLGVDLSSDITGVYTGTTLANGLYANNVLNVGNNAVLFPNTIAQFSGNVASYMQINQQNFNPIGSADMILTADTGTNANSYVDLGINNSQFNPVTNQSTSQHPYDGYLIVTGPGQTNVGNLVLGTSSTGANVVFAVGGFSASNIVATLTPNSLVMNTATYITFGDGTKQYTGYSGAASATANNASANTIYTQGVDATQNTKIAINSANTAAAFNLANTANIIIPGNVTFDSTVTLAGNTIFSGNTIHYGNLYTTGNLVTIGSTITYGSLQTYGNSVSNGTSTFNGPTIFVGDRITNGNVINNGNSTFNGTFINNGNTYNNGLTTLNGILSVNGSIIPANTNISLGSAQYPFQNIYTNNSTIVLANSSIVTNGNLTANGQSTFNGLVVMQNQQYNSNVGALEIIGSSSGQMVPPAANGTMLHITGLDNITTKLMVDSFGPGNTYSLFVGRSGRGTASAPTPVQAGDTIVRFGGSSYGGPNTTFVTSGSARMDIIALENHSDTNRGTMISFSTTAVGSNLATQNVVTIAANVMNIGTNTTLSVANVIQYNASVNNGTVTQLTSKSTAVTCNGRTGQIITSNATLNKGVAVQFTVNNSYVVSNKDVIILNIASGASVGYNISANSVAPGSFSVNLHNADSTPSGSNASDALTINFAIIRVA